MSGLMTALAGGTIYLVYASGLYGPNGVDLTPISDFGNSPTTFTRNWVGYYLPTTSGSKSFSLTSTWSSTYSDGLQYSYGYLWLGSTAKSGYNAGNANVFSSDSTASTNISVTAGQYYPIRLQWSANLTSGFEPVFGNPYSTTGVFSLSISGSTSPALYYNSQTNGF